MRSSPSRARCCRVPWPGSELIGPSPLELVERSPARFAGRPLRESKATSPGRPASAGPSPRARPPAVARNRLRLLLEDSARVPDAACAPAARALGPVCPKRATSEDSAGYRGHVARTAPVKPPRSSGRSPRRPVALLPEHPDSARPVAQSRMRAICSSVHVRERFGLAFEEGVGHLPAGAPRRSFFEPRAPRSTAKS